MMFTRLCGLVPVYLLGLMNAGTAPADMIAVGVIVLTTIWGYFSSTPICVGGSAGWNR